MLSINRRVRDRCPPVRASAAAICRGWACTFWTALQAMFYCARERKRLIVFDQHHAEGMKCVSKGHTQVFGLATGETTQHIEANICDLGSIIFFRRANVGIQSARLKNSVSLAPGMS